MLTGKCLHTLKGHTDYVGSASFSPDGTTLVTASNDKTDRLRTPSDTTAKIWDVQTGNCLHTLVGHTAMVNLAGFTPDGTTIVTISHFDRTTFDSTTKIWDVQTGNCLNTITSHDGCY